MSNILSKLNLINTVFADNTIENTPLNFSTETSTIGTTFSFLSIILITCILLISLLAAYFYLSKKVSNPNHEMGSYLKVLERRKLGRDSFVYILKIDKKGIVLAENNNCIVPIFQIDDEDFVKEIDVNTIDKFESLNFDSFLSKESYKISTLKKKNK